MTLSSVVLLLMRRWYVALLGLLLTVLLAVEAASVVKPEYDAAASVLLLPPTKKGDNPYTDLAAVPGVPEVLSRVLHDSAYADKYKQAGIRQYEVGPDESAGGPAVLVIGKGSTNEEALSAMRTVAADVSPALRELQVEAGVVKPNLITSRRIYVETEATKVGKKQIRAVIAAVGAGLVLTLLLVGAVDALIRRRAGRRDQDRRTAEVSPDAAPSSVQSVGPDPDSVGRADGNGLHPSAARGPRPVERTSAAQAPDADAQ